MQTARKKWFVRVREERERREDYATRYLCGQGKARLHTFNQNQFTA